MNTLFLLILSVDKVETLKRYKFSLAFENSNEEDYVTEKFFQSLVAGKSLHFFLLMFLWLMNILNPYCFFYVCKYPYNWYYCLCKLCRNL